MCSANLALGKSVAALIGAMADEIWQVRIKAAASLGKLHDAAAIPALGAALDASSRNLRKEATAALGEIGHADALPYLIAHKDDPDPDVRKINRWAAAKVSGAA